MVALMAAWVLAAEPEIQGPVPLASLSLAWPEEADATLGNQAVTLDIILDAQGKVVEAQLLSGQPPFDALALDYAKTLLFTPALDATGPVPVAFTLTLSFVAPLPVVPVPADNEPGIVGTYALKAEDPRLRAVGIAEGRLLPGTLGDPLRALQDLPGVVRMPLDSGWLLVRGGNPRDTGIYVNGLRVPQLQHLGGFTGILHPAWFDSVDFWAGGAPSRYGRATAGIVDVSTLPKLPGLSLQAGASVALADIFVSVPLRPHLSAAAAWRRSYLDALVGLVAASDAVPSFSDWQGRLDIGDTQLFTYHFSDKLRGSSPSGQPVELRLASHRLQLRMPGEIQVDMGGGWDQSTVEILESGSLRQDTVASVSLRIERPDAEIEKMGLTLGLDPQFQWHEVRVDALQRALVLVQPDSYAQWRIGLENPLSLGLRVEPLFVEGQSPRLGVSPHLSEQVHLGPRLLVLGDLGLSHQPPPEDLLVGTAEGAVLPLERAFAGGAGLHFMQKPLRLELDSYVRWQDRLTLWEQDGSLGVGRGLSFGLESLTRLDYEHWTGWISYSWARSLRQEEVGLDWAPSSVDQPQTLTAVQVWNFRHAWSFSSRFRYSSGLILPPEVGTVVDLFTGRSFPIDRSQERLPAFHSLDIKLSKTFALHHSLLDTYIDVQNVYNHRVPEPVITPMADTYSTYVVGLPFLPILGIEWRRPG